MATVPGDTPDGRAYRVTVTGVPPHVAGAVVADTYRRRVVHFARGVAPSARVVPWETLRTVPAGGVVRVSGETTGEES